MPIVVLQVYDRVLPNESYATLGVLVSALVVVALADGFLNFARGLILARCGARYEYDLNVNAIDAVLSSDLATFESEAQGAHLERVQGIDAIREFYHGPAMLFVVELPFVFLFLFLIWRFAGAMVLVPVAVIVLFIAISTVAGMELRKAIADKSEHHERRQNFMIEALGGIHTIKALAMEQQVQRRHERLQGNSARSTFVLARINTVVQGLAGTFSQGVMVAFVGIGSLNVIDGRLSVGALAAGTMLAGRVLQPALRALSFWTFHQTIAEKEARLEEMLALPAETMQTGTARPPLTGRIELRNVSFGFEKDTPPLLKEINLLIEPGQSVSIRGANGCGKSTLINLIMGFVRPDSGQILLDEHPIQTLDPSWVRSRIGLIPQAGVLFEGSLLENMTLFREGEPVVQAISLARRLGLDATITKLPDGLDTLANGDLSQAIPHGFAQRLVTVRALLGDLSIVIFDDGNPGLDERNDSYLRDLLIDLKRDHTLVVVSHRPSLQRVCDEHYEIRDGRLVRSSAEFQSKRFDTRRLRLLKTLTANQS